MSDVEIHIAAGAPQQSGKTIDTLEEKIASDLWKLTEVLVKLGHQSDGGFLGGKFGYGVDFENDRFMMHQFCWCGRGDCPWCKEEPCNCACEHCKNCKEKTAPNFAIKSHSTGEAVIKIKWYKWIGRSMEIWPPTLTLGSWATGYQLVMDSIKEK